MLKSIPDCMDIVRRLVKPERDRNKRKQRRETLVAIYGEHRSWTVRSDRRNSTMCSRSRSVSNAVMPVRVPTGQVFAHMCVVFALDDFASLALLVVEHPFDLGDPLHLNVCETDIRYSPSDVFLTLPRPQPTPELEALGRAA